eukprot:751231-Hanusia_phi.AAC.12
MPAQDRHAAVRRSLRHLQPSRSHHHDRDPVVVCHGVSGTRPLELHLCLHHLRLKLRVGQPRLDPRSPRRHHSPVVVQLRRLSDRGEFERHADRVASVVVEERCDPSHAHVALPVSLSVSRVNLRVRPQDGLSGLFPREVAEGLRRVSAVVVPVPVVVVLDVVPLHQLLNSDQRPSRPLHQLGHICHQEVHVQARPAIEPLCPHLGLHLHRDVVEVGLPVLLRVDGHLGDKLVVRLSQRQVAHLVGSSQRSLCEGDLVDLEDDGASLPLLGDGVEVFSHRLLRPRHEVVLLPRHLHAPHVLRRDVRVIRCQQQVKNARGSQQVPGAAG